MNNNAIREFDTAHIACNDDGCPDCNNGTLPDLRTVRPGSKRKHGPNITVSSKRDIQPRTYSHARIAVEQAKADVLALRSYSSRTAMEVIASLDMQIDEIRRYLDGE